jgi:dTDP-4-dehydrorhamnose reductase
MRVLITGAAGQLGQALLAYQLDLATEHRIDVIATTREGGDGSLSLDLSDQEACRSIVQQWRPDWLINAGAYTAVDQAEREPELAYAVNAAAPAAFAESLQEYGGRLLQISTDFVFSGDQGSPYRTNQAVNPIGVYGSSKAAGEEAVLNRLAHARAAVILRTSWVYGPVGRNFLLTMLRLHQQRAADATPLGVVADQVGCPTATAGLAQACWRVLLASADPHHAIPDILHWSDAGAATWYDFAVVIGEFAQRLGLLEKAACVSPIATKDYPTPARRPAYSLLDCSSSRQILGLAEQHWQQALFDVMHQVAH